MKDRIHEFYSFIKEVLKGPLPEAFADFDEAVVKSDRRTRAFGYWVVAIVFGGFGLWAALAPLESAARGQGTVQVEGNRKPLQHFEGGIVEDIFIASGDYVTEGQPLIQLDPTVAQAEHSIIEGRVWAARALMDRVMSERDDLEEIDFVSWLLEEPDQRARVAIESERALFSARRAGYLGEIAVLEQQISQLKNQIVGTQAVIEAKDKVARSLQSEHSELEELLQEGYVDKQRIRELDRALTRTLGELAELDARVAAAKVSVGETELKILQLNKRFKTEVVESLSVAQEEFYDMQQRLLAADDRLTRTLITAPASGYVLGLKPNVEGAVVGAGEELMAIVPDVDRLVVDTKLSPMDIDRIALGQEAEVRFAVFKDAYTITGSLTKLSADTLTDPNTGEIYFEGKVTLDEEDMSLLGGYQLVPGMPADVLIKTGSRTLLGYLTSPMHRMFENALIED